MCWKHKNQAHIKILVMGRGLRQSISRSELQVAQSGELVAQPRVIDGHQMSCCSLNE